MKHFLAGIFICLTSKALAVEVLWGVTGVGGAASSLYAINPGNAQLYGLVGSTGKVCLSGLAIQPGTGALLAAQGQLSPTGSSVKGLFRIDLDTGVATTIGSMANIYAISDVAMRPDGTLFGFGIGATVKKVVTISTANAAVTTIGNTNNITNVSMSFGTNGTLYLARTNALFTVNTTTGVTTLVSAITGASTQIDNFMATRSNGKIYVGLRGGGGTTLYVIDPSTAVTTLVGTVSGVALSGIEFGNVSPPTLALKKPKKKVKSSSITLKGSVTGSGTKVTVNGKAVQVTNGAYSIKTKLKTGKNTIRIVATDVVGQIVQAKAKVTRLKS